MNQITNSTIKETPPNPDELTAYTTNGVDILTPEQKAEKEAKFNEALAALKRLMKLRNRSGSRNTPGAFGGPKAAGRKNKKKLARYLERNTVE